MKKGKIFKLILSYNGTNFHGWQIQRNSISKSRTIQGEINRAFSQLCSVDISEIKTLGSGRTDSGVHAIGQVCKLILPIELPLKAILNGGNSLLDPDIRIIEAHLSSEDFHPVRDAFWKEYQYFFTLESKNFQVDPLFPFLKDKIVYLPHKNLDIETIQESMDVFLGTHDFQNFRCQGTNTLTTTRTIYFIDLIKVPTNNLFTNLNPSYYVFRIVGNGFLKQMVRLMVGSLWELGEKKIKRKDIESYLLAKEFLKSKLAPTAPAHGLYLKEVNYQAPFEHVITSKPSLKVK
jgi:tRNA pseudouridine38-40 synthase